MSRDQVGWLDEHSALERHLVVAMRHAAAALAHGDPRAHEAAQEALEAITRASDGAGARRRFWSLRRTLGRHARRVLQFHQPSCPCLGGDEARLLAIWQHLRVHRRGHATVLARAIVGERKAEVVLRHAALVATRVTPPQSRASSPETASVRATAPAQAARLH